MGLVECTVQLVVSQVHKWVLIKGLESWNFWGMAILQMMLNINTRLIWIYGFTLTELMFGYKPQWNCHDLDNGLYNFSDLEDYPDQPWGFYIEQHAELWQKATMSVTKLQARIENSQNPMWMTPKPGDLVLVQDLSLDKDYSRKLDL